MTSEIYYLQSVKKHLIAETCEIVGIDKNTRIINMNDIKSVDQMDDSWFSLLSDEDLGTVTNAINNRI